MGKVWGKNSDALTTSGAAHTTLSTLIAGERNQDSADNSYLVAKNEVNFTRIDLSTATPVAVSAGAPAYLCGLYVDVALSAHVVTVDDGAAGAITIATIPVSTSVGAFDIGNNGHDIRCETALAVTPNASSTGILVVYWRLIG